MDLDYNQISRYINLTDNFWELSDSELVSDLIELPKEWSMYIINFKLNRIDINTPQLELKDIITRFRGIFDQLGINSEDRFKNMGTDTFYLSNVLFLEMAINLIEIFTEKEHDYISDLNPLIIEYIKVISIEEEKYEILSDLKNLELI